VIRSTIIYAYEYQCRQWQSRTCPDVPARLARAWCSKIAKISNFTLLRASRLRKDRLINFRNFFYHFVRLLFPKKMSRRAYLWLSLALTRSPSLQYPNSLFALKRAKFACHAPFFGSLTGSAREPEPRIVAGCQLRPTGCECKYL